MSIATMWTPERTQEQRRAALQRANDVRHLRAQLKLEIRAGRVRLADLLADPPDYLRSARVYDFALLVPKLGTVTVNRAFRKAEVSASKTFSGITSAQVQRLRREMRGRV